jgi:23S rRNA pseudouridine1911/1915/1917 synthase
VGGDVLEFAWPETTAAELRPAEIALTILFEDEHLLAVDKAAGMVVHPGAGTGGDTLVHALLAHCRGGLSGIGGVERPGIVHRLDKDTTGVVIAAKTDAAHRGLSAQFADRSLQKEYLALVSGAPALLSGSIVKAIGRNPRQRHKMAVVEAVAGGRDARTDWTVVERFGPFATLVRCRIYTGRTHQIRVHFKSLGHSLLGDSTYGWKAHADLPAPNRVMLHAEHLALTHPITGQPLDLRAPVPEDFKAMMRELRKRVAPTRAVRRPKGKPKGRA